MPSQNTKRIIAYLSYLRDISRKIVSRNGFEKCLLSKTLGYAIQLDELPFIVGREDDKFDELNNYYNFLQRQHDKKLFIGYGTILGTRKRLFAAPIVTLQCEITKDESTHSIKLEPDIETININYDLISALSANYLNEEDDVINILDEDENRILENIESQLKEITHFEDQNISNLSISFFKELKQKIDHFRDIQEVHIDSYSFQNELKKYLKRTIRYNTSNNNNRVKSLFENELVYVEANHLFLSNVPDQLSTFEALNSFVDSINDDGEFKNPVVEKLLVNALTENRVEIERISIENDIQNVINKKLPIPLSNRQVQALKNAWTNEISYIQGPPGTGKSHTISAIVLSAIAMKKKVLVVSQKVAALQVVNKKIEPYLSDGDGLLGICYYDTTARKKIKNYCGYLKEQLTNSTQFNWQLANFKNNLQNQESKLFSLLNNLENEEIRLNKSLEKERHFKEINDQLIIEIKRHNLNFSEIPNGFNFEKIRNKQKYTTVLDHIEKIWDSNNRTLASKLFINKFKKHLEHKFKTPQNWLGTETLPYFSKSFINLNNLYTEVLSISRELNINSNNIRGLIKNIKSDIKVTQEKITKLTYKCNVYDLIINPVYSREIDKFNGMLNNVNSRIIDRKMKEIDFHKITDIIPFWTAEIRHLGHLFPLVPDLFDLVIVDEASQVNLAEILPAFYRGKKLCIVGDHQQLSLKASGLNFSLGKNFDELTWEKHNRSLMRYQTATSKKLTVTQASILDFIKSEENNVILTEVMLDEHFRSLPKLARYTNRRFYTDQDNPEGKLKIMTETPDRLSIECFKAVNVNGKRESITNSKIIIAEAEEVVKIIYSLTSATPPNFLSPAYAIPNHIDPNKFTIGVISMIREQCSKIAEMIDEKLPNLDTKYELMIGTPEEFQGNEKDIIIFSLCLDIDCLRGQGHYQDDKRLNVATSRAKSFTYFVYSPFDRTFNKIYNIINIIY